MQKNITTQRPLSNLQGNLNRYYQSLKVMLKPSGSVTNPLLRGHFEAHYEKIDNLIFELNQILPGSQNPSTSRLPEGLVLPAGKFSEHQSIRIMHNNLKILAVQVRDTLSRQKHALNEKKIKYCQELLRIITNDQCRTAYLLQ